MTKRKKNKITNNDQQHAEKKEQQNKKHKPHYKPGMNSCAPEGYVDYILLVAM